MDAGAGGRTGWSGEFEIQSGDFIANGEFIALGARMGLPKFLNLRFECQRVFKNDLAFFTIILKNRHAQLYRDEWTRLRERGTRAIDEMGVAGEDVIKDARVEMREEIKGEKRGE